MSKNVIIGLVVAVVVVAIGVYLYKKSKKDATQKGVKASNKTEVLNTQMGQTQA